MRYQVKDLNILDEDQTVIECKFFEDARKFVVASGRPHESMLIVDTAKFVSEETILLKSDDNTAANHINMVQSILREKLYELAKSFKSASVTITVVPLI